MPDGLVIAVYGPTASGKTAVAEALAARIPAGLVSADSAALYRGLELLTAAPPPGTRLAGVFDLDHEVSVGEYARLAHAAVDELLGAGVTPIVVGGTGLYLRAALSELDVPPAPAAGVRERWEASYDDDPAAAYAELARLDPAAAAAVHPNDRRRVVRALELADAGSSLRPADSRLWSGETRHPTLLVGLDLPPHVLEGRIRARSERMAELGVAQEARRALAGPLSSTAAKVLGLREAAALPDPAALEALVRETGRLARYQRKWLRRLPGIVMIDADRPAGEVADAILEVARAWQQLPRGRAR